MTTTTTPMGDMLPILKESLRQQIEQSNALVAQITAATGDTENLLVQIRDSLPTEDKNILKFREFIEKLEARKREETEKIHEYIKQNALPNVENVDVDALKEQHKKLADSIKSGRGFATGLPNFDPETFNSEMPELKTLRGTTVKTGTDGRSGGKKPRFEMAFLAEGLNPSDEDYRPIFKEIEQSDGSKKKASNFTILAAHLTQVSGKSVTATELQELALAEAKVPDLNALNGASFSFPLKFNTGTEKEKNYWVKIQPKQPA